MKIEHILLNSHPFGVAFAAVEHDLCPTCCSIFLDYFLNIFPGAHFERANKIAFM